MRVLLGALATVSALALTGAAPAKPPVPAHKLAQKTALAAIAKGLGAGRIDPAAAARYRADVNRAAALVPRLPHARSAEVTASLEQAAALAGKLTGARATALFGQLRVTCDWFATRGVPPAQTDSLDGEGVVHRYFPGHGFVFHPLGAFIALNAAVAAGEPVRVERLVDALIARGVPQPGGGTGWEYYFPYAGGRPPWLSGMAQAVAAQAFLRAGRVLPGESAALTAHARAAYEAIPGRLAMDVAGGVWIRLYSFNRLAVLNAQLQAVVSLSEFATATGDAGAKALAARLEATAAAQLERFDTGFWTLYALHGNLSSLGYQRYVADLLKRLSPRDERFAAAARRIPSYETQPPAFQLADAGVGAVRFWLSKPASVRVAGGGSSRSLALGDGWHTVALRLPKRPGSYPVTVTARDWAGNSASVKALPLVRVVPLVPERPPGKKKPRAKTVAARPAADGPALVAGAGADTAEQARLVLRQGYRALRTTVAWPAGADTPDAAALEAVRDFPASARLVVELVAEPLPADDASLGALAAYAGALVRELPAVTDLVLGPPPPAGAVAPAYAAALAAVHAAVKAGRPDVAVAASVDGAAGPRAAVAALARAHRTAQLLDEIAFRPAPASGGGAWGIDALPELAKALAASFGAAAPPVLVDAVAVQTRIPPAKKALYESPGTPVPGAATEAAQGAAYERAFASSRCRPEVTGVFLRRLVDAAAPGERSGVYFPDGTPKTSASTAAQAAVAAMRQGPICPGLRLPVAAGTLAFPERLSPRGAPEVRLTCTRACLYLVTLERADGKPVLARRGQLPAGEPPATVRLAAAPLPAGVYRFTVRLVGRTNPGPVHVASSGSLSVG